MTSYIGYMTAFDSLAVRYGIWRCGASGKNGSVILLSGRSEFMEKYEEIIGELNRRKFDVYSFDWRGQGLSGRMLTNRYKGFVRSYDDYVRDLALFMTDVVGPGAVRPLIILSHSMGAHIALRYLHDFPRAVQQAVLVSPMIDIITFPFPVNIARLLTRQAIRSGRQDAYAIGYGDYRPPDMKAFKNNKLTSDFRRFMREKQHVDSVPELALGGVTYGWLAATFDSIDVFQQPDYGKRIQVPMLMVSAEKDQVVSNPAQRELCIRLPRCDIAEISGAYHEILQETDTIRSDFWALFDRFVRKSS